MQKWEKEGRPSPPLQYVKQRNLIAVAKRYGLNIFIETGTYRGDTIEAVKGHFERVFSIELCPELACLAEKKFETDDHVEIIQGDSGSEIENVLKRINEPALFWLDGHYSAGETARGGKDTPIMEELDCILNSEIEGHIIVIDDARCFRSDLAYPAFEDLEQFIYSITPDAMIKVEDDHIRIILQQRDIQ